MSLFVDDDDDIDGDNEVSVVVVNSLSPADRKLLGVRFCRSFLDKVNMKGNDCTELPKRKMNKGAKNIIFNTQRGGYY